MRTKLKTKITVEGTEEKGKLIISYFNANDLDTIYRAVMGEEE